MVVAALILQTILLFAPPVAASPFSDYDLDGTTIVDGSSHAVDIGNVAAGKEIDFTFFSDEDIDGLLMTDSQYQSWTTGGTDFLRAGSGLDVDLELYTYTVEAADHFWYVLDNSAQNPGGATGGADATISTGGINIGDPLTDGIDTRMMLDPGTMVSYDLGMISSSKLLELSISCDDWLSDDIDVFVVSGSNQADFEEGSSVWNRNASYLDTCFEQWSYELESSDSWTVYLENGPRGGAAQISESVQIDIHFWTRSHLPSELTADTRMIEDGDAWRVDLGSLLADDTLTFSLSLDGLFDEVDILIMESAEADTFLAGGTATVLGHPSMVDVDFFDSWDYRFPRAGAYSMLIDNSAEPQGGADNNGAVHAEITVIETTILSDFLGWYQSRHYVSDGGYVSFDVGNLEINESIGYIVSGHSHGSGVMNKFDVLVFNDTEYQSYASGEQFTQLDEYSSLDGWLSFFEDFEVAEAGHYWVVIDIADGPLGGADANGVWTFDFTITSDASITSPQTEDGNYEMTATNLGGNVPAPPDDGTGGDGGTGGDDGTDGTGNTGGTDGGSDSGVPDIGDAKNDEEVPGFSVLMALSVIGLVAIGRRRVRL